MRENLYLDKLYNSNKPLIIYKVKGGYDLFTDFSEKIILSKNNINQFFNKLKYKKKNRFNDLYIGFFGYEILCNLIEVKLSKLESMIIVYEEHIENLEKENQALKAQVAFLKEQLQHKTFGKPKFEED